MPHESGEIIGGLFLRAVHTFFIFFDQRPQSAYHGVKLVNHIPYFILAGRSQAHMQMPFLHQPQSAADLFHRLDNAAQKIS